MGERPKTSAAPLDKRADWETVASLLIRLRRDATSLVDLVRDRPGELAALRVFHGLARLTDALRTRFQETGNSVETAAYRLPGQPSTGEVFADDDMEAQR